MGMKRLIVVLVSLVYAGLLQVRRLAARMVGEEPGSSCVVLYYHSIKSDQKARFARQLDHLRRWRLVISPKAILSTGSVESNCVAITFDDSFSSALTHAVHELTERDLPAAFFVPTGFIGKMVGWEMEADHEDKGETVASEKELEMATSELFCFGSHTVSHSRLTDLSPAQVKFELQESKSTLERLLGRKVELFSFPYGSFNRELLAQVRSTGYTRVFGIESGISSFSESEFVCERVKVDPSDTLLEFHLKITGAYSWLSAALRTKSQLLIGLGLVLNAIPTRFGRSTRSARV